MDTFKVSCQEQVGKSFNYVIDGQDFMFMGGKSTKINDSVWAFIKGKKNSKSRPLFIKEVVEVKPTVPVAEEVLEVKVQEEKVEIVEDKPKFSVLDLKPPDKRVVPQNKSFKSVTKKVQGKLT